MRAGLEASTVTPASTPPVSSLANPRMPPVAVWAETMLAPKAMTTVRQSVRVSAAIGTPLRRPRM